MEVYVLRNIPEDMKPSAGTTVVLRTKGPGTDVRRRASRCLHSGETLARIVLTRRCSSPLPLLEEG